VRRKMGREKRASIGADAAEATTRNTKTTGKSRRFRWNSNITFLRLVNRNTKCSLKAIKGRLMRILSVIERYSTAFINYCLHFHLPWNNCVLVSKRIRYEEHSLAG